MTIHVRQNTYAAWLDGDATAMEALRALCGDYEEVEQSYKDFAQIRDGLRDQISQVVDKLGGKVELRGFGTLMVTSPTVSEGYDKTAIRALIMDLVTDYPDIAARIAACATKSARAGGLRIEREKIAHA